MRRGLVIAAAVLLPFGALVAIGFSLLRESAPLELPPPPVLPEPVASLQRPSPVQVPVSRPTPPPVAAPQLPEPPPTPDPSAPPEVLEELRRKPTLVMVDRLVRQCFNDASERFHQAQQVTVVFNTTAAGGFENVVVKKASWQDPQLTACVIDAFEDAHFEATGYPMRRQTHTFTFSPADAGH